MTLSILIVNWKSKEFVRECLKSIAATCSAINPQLIVVDGGSFDGCGEMLAQEFPHVHFVQSQQNVGFGRANNLGFQSVTGEAVLLLNPDTILQPGAVQMLLHGLISLPKAGMVAPRLLNTDDTLQTSCVQAFPTPINQALDSNFLRKVFPKSNLWGTYEAFNNDNPVPVEAVSGACMLMPSTLFKKLGGFTPDYFMYAEDMDLCLKVHRAGFQVYHLPGAKVIHHGGGSSRTQFSKFSTVMGRHALHTYMRLNHCSRQAGFYRFATALSAILRLSVLWPASVFCPADKRPRITASLNRWLAALSWSLGMEKAPSAAVTTPHNIAPVTSSAV